MEEENNEMASLRRWQSLGHGEEYAVSAAVLEDSLVAGIASLRRTRQPRILDITGGALLPEALALPRDDPLLPLWTRFAKALAKPRGGEASAIDLHITHSSLTTEVMDVLEPALRAAPLDYLLLSHNRLGREGIQFAARVLRANPRVRYLVFANNRIDDREDLLSLVRAAREHPALEYFNLEGCGIGSKRTIVPHCVPHLLQTLHTVNLAGNDIGSIGAVVVSTCLVANPATRILVLDDNRFDDDDATLFATSLKTNTTLLQLDLCGNNFTRAGIETLLKSTFDDRSLNTLQGSNHTCRLKISPDGDPATSASDEAALAINGRMFCASAFSKDFRNRCVTAAGDDLDELAKLMLVRGRARVKVLHAFWRGSGSGDGNLRHLAALPPELVPTALAVLQECGHYAGTEGRNLATVFAVMRASPCLVSFLGAGPKQSYTPAHVDAVAVASLFPAPAPQREYTTQTKYDALKKKIFGKLRKHKKRPHRQKQYFDTKDYEETREGKYFMEMSNK